MIISRPPFPATVLAALALAAFSAFPAPARAGEGDRIVGSGVTKTETRTVAGFHALALGVHATIDLRQDGTEGLSITGDDNIVPLIETVVEDGTLKIRWKKETESTQYKEVSLVVHAANIDGLAIAGSGELAAKTLKSGKLRISLAGSGRMTLDALSADSARVSIDGSGQLTVAGRVEELVVSTAGSGRLSAAKLESRTATIVVAGSGSATTWASETLTGKVAGSGAIRYYGNPRVTSTVAGSGTVTRAGDRPG